MRAAFRKLLTWIFVGCLLAIGVSVASEFFIEVARDKGWYDNAGTRFDAMVSAISATATSPWALWAVGLLGAFVAGLWIDVLLRRREAGLMPQVIPDVAEQPLLEPAIESPDPWAAESKDEADSKHDLIIFFDEFIAPAIRAQLTLQESLLRCTIDGEYLVELAARGAMNSEEALPVIENLEKISDCFSGSPQLFMSISGLIICVRTIRKGYVRFCSISDKIFNVHDNQSIRHREVRDAWNDWVACHNRLIDNYERVRLERRFGSLYRPTAEGEWGSRQYMIGEGGG